MIIIGNKSFKTKKEAEICIQEILYRYQLDTPLKGEDLTFIYDLLECHPDADTKIGVGVKSIIIEMERVFNKTRHFSIIRTDGSSTDFSLKKCLSPTLNEPIKLFRSSARRVIANQIISFRDDYFSKNKDSGGNIQCPISGTLINKNNSHVDHIPPDTFDKIISDFIKLNNIDIKNIQFAEAPNGIGRVFIDNNLINSFSDYHQNHANLRIVSVTANLKQKKK